MHIYGQFTYTIGDDELLIGGFGMRLDSIGKNIRTFRMANNLRQEDLAELTGLSANYIGMVERGEKIPSLETFITIANALKVSSDMILSDVIEAGYIVKISMYNDKLEKLPAKERERIDDVIDTLLRHVDQSHSH